MGGSATWRSLNSVMLVTLHVAVVATVLRSLAGPTAVAGAAGFWLPLSIGVAVFLSWPLGRAITSAFEPDSSAGLHRCRACGNAELRPLLRAGRGIFQPVMGHRCVICGTTHRMVDDVVILERPGGEPSGVQGIEFLAESPPPLSRDEIRFLDDDHAGPANFASGPVSR